MMTTLEELVGNKDAVEKASKMLQSGNIPQSILLTGPCPDATEKFAKAFSEKLLGKAGLHSDLYLFRPEGKSGQHPIETLRTISSLLPLPPTQAKRKVCILLEADRMQLTGANAFLKTLEEPAQDSVLILTSKHPRRILPTLLSRCQQIHLKALSPEEIASWLISNHHLDPATAQTFAKLAEGSQGRAEHLLGTVAYRQSLLEFLETGAEQGVFPYFKLHELSGAIAARIESNAKQIESDNTEAKPSLSSAQAAAEERIEEGRVTLLLKEGFQLLCIQILAYFRDRQAVLMGASRKQLYDASLVDHPAPLAPQFSRIEFWEEKIQKANQLLDRFTPLRTCIEAIFL